MHVGTRYYEIETGRWVQKDPWLGIVTNPLTLNQYLYCLNNPTNAIDPYGNNPLALLFLLGGCLFLAGCKGCGESIPVHSAPVGTVIHEFRERTKPKVEDWAARNILETHFTDPEKEVPHYQGRGRGWIRVQVPGPDYWFTQHRGHILYWKSGMKRPRIVPGY